MGNSFVALLRRLSGCWFNDMGRCSSSSAGAYVWRNRARQGVVGRRLGVLCVHMYTIPGGQKQREFGNLGPFEEKTLSVSRNSRFWLSAFRPFFAVLNRKRFDLIDVGKRNDSDEFQPVAHDE